MKHIFNLLFRRKAFVENFITDANIAEKEQDECRKDFTERTVKKRKGMLVEFVAVVAIVFLAYISARAVNAWLAITASWITLFRLAALAVVAWSVLSRLGYETETYKGVSLLERTSLSAFKLFYLVGLFLGVVSIFLAPSI
jgi:hypothetical protein